MRLEFIALDKLDIARTNMRYGRKSPDVSDLLPTVRARGVLQTLLVRPNGSPGHYEIVAGRRRWHAARIVAEERRMVAEAADYGGQGDVAVVDPLDLPCAILDAGDDADAVEASLIENLARLDPDEVTQWQTFTRLVREGRSVEDIALTFGLPDLMVRRVLALGNLLPRIRALYGADKIDRVTVRHLTLASKRQQQDWLALMDDPDQRAPTGHPLKAWLFGGASIPVRYALFDVEASGLAVVADLFGEDRFFADSDAFWAAQNAEIEVRRAAFVEAGWPEAVVVPPTQHFASWEHAKASKRKGGRVYLDVRGSGEVVIHEGYVSCKEALRQDRDGSGEAVEKPVRPEISTPIQTYIDLHRHAAVRAGLLTQPSIALRLMVAHAIVGSALWNVQIEAQSAASDAIAESVETCVSEANFDEKRRAVLALLGFDPETPTVKGGYDGGHGLAGLFARLLELPDPAVFDVMTVVMGETLEAGTALIEVLGRLLGTDMAAVWQADDALLGLIRDREVLSHVLADVAGEAVAAANARGTGKVQRRIIRDCLTGTNGRDKVTGWVPKWMAFPPSAYTGRGGVGTVRRAGTVADLAASAAPLARPQAA